MISLSKDSSALSAEFSVDEIVKQLEALGYRNIPPSLIHEFKRDLDEIVKEDLLKSTKKQGDQRRAEPRSVFSGTLVQKTTNGQFVQTNLKHETNDSFKNGAQILLSKPTSHNVASPVSKRLGKSPVGAFDKIAATFNEESLAKEASGPVTDNTDADLTTKSKFPSKVEMTVSSSHKAAAFPGDVEVDLRMKRLCVSESNHVRPARFEVNSDEEDREFKMHLQQETLPASKKGEESESEANSESDSDGISEVSDNEDDQPLATKRQSHSSIQRREPADNRGPRFRSVYKDNATYEKHTARSTSSAASFGAARSACSTSRRTNTSTSTSANLTRSSVIYSDIVKQRPGMTFEKHDPVRRFASYRDTWNNAQSTYTGLFGNGSHRQLRWTIRMMMKRVRDEAKEREQAMQVRRAAARKRNAVAHASASATLTGLDVTNRKDRQLHSTARNTFAQRYVPVHRNGEHAMHQRAAYDKDDSVSSEEPDENESLWKPNTRHIEQVFQPFLLS